MKQKSPDSSSRRNFLTLTGTAGLAATLTVMKPLKLLAGEDASLKADTARKFPASPVPDRIILSWTDNPAKSQTVTWRTDNSVKAPLVQIAKADGSPYFKNNSLTVNSESKVLKKDGWEDHYHQVCFKNLQPETFYHYRLQNGEDWSEWFQFRTASENPDRFSFIYLGDAQNNILSAWSHVVRRAMIQNPDVRFILHAGDLINHDDSDDEWGEWHAGDGWAQSGISCIATPGNHEYGLTITPQWKYQFAFPDNGPNLRRLRNTVYYIDYQGVRFISLDTTLMSFPHVAHIQKIWLKKILKNNPHQWTVITHHHPMESGSSGRKGHPMLNIYFRKLYKRYNVDLVLQGHDHTYARGNIDHSGPVYVISVSGPKMYDSDAPWADVSGGDLQFFQNITIEGDTLSFQAYTAVGNLFDAFDLEKQRDGSSILIEKM